MRRRTCPGELILGRIDGGMDLGAGWMPKNLLLDDPELVQRSQNFFAEV